MRGKNVLEIGCGGAQSAIAFAKLGAHVTAVDIAASEISFAKRLAGEHRVCIEPGTIHLPVLQATGFLIRSARCAGPSVSA